MFENIVDALYKLFLPLKFFITRKLDFDDKIHSGFYVIDGDWKLPFPFLDELMETSVSNTFTVYLIDYSTPSDLSGALQYAQYEEKEIRTVNHGDTSEPNAKNVNPSPTPQKEKPSQGSKTRKRSNSSNKYPSKNISSNSSEGSRIGKRLNKRSVTLDLVQIDKIYGCPSTIVEDGSCLKDPYLNKLIRDITKYVSQKNTLVQH